MNVLWRDSARTWLAEHLAAAHWMLLALWVPPIAFAIGVNLRLVGGAGSGYQTLRDPSLILGAAQVSLMAAALPGMVSRRPRSWWFACVAVAAWSAHVAWGILSRVRLSGVRELLSFETVTAVAGLALAALVVIEVRWRYTVAATISYPPTTTRRPVVPPPGASSVPANQYQKPESRVG